MEQQQLPEIKDGSAVLVMVSTNEYSARITELMKDFISRGYVIYYLTFNKPHVKLVELFQKENIDTARMFFIDTVSSTTNGTKSFYIANPSDLLSISITLSEISASSTAEKKLFFLDSISTFELYAVAERLVKFLHFTVNKLRAGGFTVVLYSTDNINAKIISALNAVTDHVIKL